MEKTFFFCIKRGFPVRKNILSKTNWYFKNGAEIRSLTFIFKNEAFSALFWAIISFTLNNNAIQRANYIEILVRIIIMKSVLIHSDQNNYEDDILWVLHLNVGYFSQSRNVKTCLMVSYKSWYDYVNYFDCFSALNHYFVSGVKWHVMVEYEAKNFYLYENELETFYFCSIFENISCFWRWMKSHVHEK